MPQQMDIQTGILAGGKGGPDLSSDTVQQFPAFALKRVFAGLKLGPSPVCQRSIQLLRIVILQSLQNAGGADRGSGHRRVRRTLLRHTHRPDQIGSRISGIGKLKTS